MRKVVTVRGGRFDLDSVRPRIEAIVAHFDQYLDEYPVKTAKSKHAVMGPVAKILERAATRKWDAQSLTGYALRVHEMNPKARGYLSPTARQALEKGTTQLVELCRTIPVTAVTKVVERIDYSLYYVRRKKGIEWLEKTRQMFIRFLQEKYHSNFHELVEAWGEKDAKDLKDFGDVRYPSIQSEAYKRASDNKKADIDAFWRQYQDQAIPEEEENND
ncbi:MAG: hypothetical protein K6T87_21145 [Roseiflexus sp.]|uniref:hypothetical protein n=1 Tax=Roseiflexus sp. TaxID=2562120 RepID=UPI0025F5A08C|nr:hypothetical protein [Roseiflexus sp.]MCL6543066.1 hypothetical protein [Roseiflexus sp.]